MNSLPFRYFSFLYLVLFGLGTHSLGREDLILSLEEVIGDPPDRSEALKNRKRDTFYSVVRSAENREMEELIRQQEQGIVLTEDDQILIQEYRMGGNVSGSNTAMRRIYPPVLYWVESRVKAASGDRYSFIKCSPKADGPFPTALILDPEIAQQKEAGMSEYFRIIRGMSAEADLPWEEPYRGRYITHSPLGNQLAAHAVSVIVPINESLEQANNISMEDWKSILDDYQKDREVDPNSFFLIATKEFAGLALKLASSYPFTGLILEEPEVGLFGQQLPSDVSDAAAMTTLQKQYTSVLESLTCDTLVFRHRQNSAIPMNDQLILKPLIDWQRPLHMSLTDFPLRRISQEDVAQEISDPRFLYDTESTKKITQRMLYFVQQKGGIPLRLMPEESTEPRSDNRASNLINQFDQMNQRLNQLMSEASSGGDSLDAGGDVGDLEGSNGNFPE